MKSRRAISPPWDKPVVVHDVATEAIRWCSKRSPVEAKQEREATMDRVRQLAAGLHKSRRVGYLCLRVDDVLCFAWQALSSNGWRSVMTKSKQFRPQ